MNAHPTPTPPELLEPARVQPDFDGMDDQGDWMLSGGKELLKRLLVAVTGMPDSMETPQ